MLNNLFKTEINALSKQLSAYQKIQDKHQEILAANSNIIECKLTQINIPFGSTLVKLKYTTSEYSLTYKFPRL